MNQEEQLEELIQIGLEAKKFKEGVLGSYIGRRARVDIDSFLDRLKSFDTTLEEDDKLRLEIRARELLFEWMDEVLQEADNAYEQYELSKTED